jgi:hypothetical protein
MLGELEEVCERTQQSMAVRAALDALSWAMFDAAQGSPGRARPDPVLR